jgi:ACS family hexuronate transporter-like MFS transporter
MDAPARSVAWRYYVCGLLLLATTINYLDRQTLAVTSVRVTDELGLNNEQYGRLELCFGCAFALGATVFGWVADRASIRWLYPAVLVLWSLMGFCTGLVETYTGLLLCRTLLGFFEAGHWPCALRTTRQILTPRERTLGNSILQSGSSIGAIFTPLLVLAMLTPERGSWRGAFQVIGLAGIGWAVFWLTALRSSDFRGPERTDDAEPGPLANSQSATADGPSVAVDNQNVEPPFWQVVCTGRFAAILLVVLAINICWHINRVWIVKFLVEGRGYSEREALGFNSAYYVATDVGCIAAGLITVWLGRRGWSVHGARVGVFNVCAVLTSASLAIPWLPAGWPLLGVLLVVGCGSLGLFPCYYSFSQDLSAKHQGKITGILGASAWVAVSLLHSFYGSKIDASGSYDTGMMLAGLCPLGGTAALLLLWNKYPLAAASQAERL